MGGSRHDELTMRVHLLMHWHEHFHEDGSKMSIGLAFEHEIPGGSVVDDGWSGTSNIKAETIIKMIDAFLLNPEHHV